MKVQYVDVKSETKPNKTILKFKVNHEKVDMRKLSQNRYNYLINSKVPSF